MKIQKNSTTNYHSHKLYTSLHWLLGLNFFFLSVGTACWFFSRFLFETNTPLACSLVWALKSYSFKISTFFWHLFVFSSRGSRISLAFMLRSVSPQGHRRIRIWSIFYILLTGIRVLQNAPVDFDPLIKLSPVNSLTEARGGSRSSDKNGEGWLLPSIYCLL